MEELKQITASRYFNKAFLTLSLFVFIVFVIRAIVVPFSNDESITFFNYAQSGDFLPYSSSVLNNNHFLNSFLTWICFRLFGDSPLSLRLPNLLSLLVLIFATHRLSFRLTQTSSKIILVTGLLLSFHWLSFFNMCRGYGISMSCMALAFSYIPDFIENTNQVDIFRIYALLSLAVCANLTLILTVIIITALISIFQLYRRHFFRVANIVALVIDSAVILFWIKYLFYLQHLDRLRSAPGGQSYWKITFVSLINTIAGKQNFLINLSVAGVYILITVAGLYFLIKRRKHILAGNTIFLFFLMTLFNGLIAGIYLSKKLFGINYPEDRMVLAFYLLFILNAAFIMDTAKPRFSKPIGITVLLVFTLHFAWSLNFKKHSLWMYGIIPERYYDHLLEEQKHHPERITIGGNDFFEPIYGFMNYKHEGSLNYMDYQDTIPTIADYYVTVKRERKYYLPYYKEIDSNRDNDTVLIKRIHPLTRKLLFTIGKQYKKLDNSQEFFNLLGLNDTLFSSRNPLLVEFNFKVLNGDMPSFSWLVLSIDSAEGKTMFYNRIPLNRIKHSWLGSNQNGDLILETGVLPKKVHRFVCYLWNVRHQQLEIEMNSVKVYQLEGYGADAGASSNGKPTYN